MCRLCQIVAGDQIGDRPVIQRVTVGLEQMAGRFPAAELGNGHRVNASLQHRRGISVPAAMVGQALNPGVLDGPVPHLEAAGSV
jgi:hypothetical protein